MHVCACVRDKANTVCCFVSCIHILSVTAYFNELAWCKIKLVITVCKRFKTIHHGKRYKISIEKQKNSKGFCSSVEQRKGKRWVSKVTKPLGTGILFKTWYECVKAANSESINLVTESNVCFWILLLGWMRTSSDTVRPWSSCGDVAIFSIQPG